MTQAWLEIDPATKVAIQAWSPPASVPDATPATCFPAAIAANFMSAGAGQVGWMWNGSAFVAAAAPAPTPAQLVAATVDFQTALADGGMTVNVGTASAPVIANVDTDAQGQADCAGNIQMIGVAAQLGKSAPTFVWDNGGGVTITLSAAQMQTISWALNSFRQATRDVAATVYAAIANGTITTTAGIAAASWPANSA